MAGSKKRCWKVYRWMWLIPDDKKPYKSTSRETDDKWDAKETMDISDSWIYHKITISSRKWYNLGSMQ